MEFRNIEFRNESTEKGIISGYAIVFNRISNVLYDKECKRFFQEMILPTSITQELLDSSDIIFNINHNREQMVARRFHGKGSLFVEWREDGVYFSFKAPNTQLGRDLLEMIDRGEVFDCSFCFTDSDAKWDFSNRECPLRTVTNITGIYDMCACWNGAYSQTEINARSIEDLEAMYKAEVKEVKPIEELKEEAGVVDDNEEASELAPEPTESERQGDILPEESAAREDTSYIEDLNRYKAIVDNLE